MENNTTARDVFMYLLVLIVLAMSAANLGTLLFQYVNIYVPDASIQQCYGTSCTDAIRWSLASIIVVFSVLVWARRFLQRDLAAHPEKSQLWVRRWAFYLTLFVSAGFVIGDAIALLFSWLQGDLTMQFILKALIILYIAGTIFYYFLKSLHPEQTGYATAVAYVAMGVVLAAVVVGFITSGSPFRARAERLDAQRVTDLQNVQYQIVYSYWESKGELPDSLLQLQDPISGYIVPVDPETKTSYEYIRKDDTSFVLCATFTTNQDMSDPYQRPSYPVYGNGNETWSHGVGRTCFDRVIDPELYRLKEGIIVQ
jgi:hypothetical protein